MSDAVGAGASGVIGGAPASSTARLGPLEAAGVAEGLGAVRAAAPLGTICAGAGGADAWFRRGQGAGLARLERSWDN